MRPLINRIMIGAGISYLDQRNLLLCLEEIDDSPSHRVLQKVRTIWPNNIP